MRYYIGTIEERNGEREYSHTIRFKTSGSPDRALDKIARNWWDDDGDREKADEGYYFSGGCYHVSPAAWEEVSKVEYYNNNRTTEM